MANKPKLESKSSQLPQQIVKEEQIMAAQEEEDPEELEGEEEAEEEEEEEEGNEDEEEIVEYEEEEEEEEEEEAEEIVEYEEVEQEGNEEEEEAEEIVEHEEEEQEGNEEEEKPDDEQKQDTQSDGNDGGHDEEPIQSVISALSKEALTTLLSDAAERHPDVAASVRVSAEADPSQRKIFVHGLSRSTTSEMLFEEFHKYGEIEDCRLVADKATGKCRGYGFILFKAGRAAREALKDPQKVINHRITSCQLASVGPLAAPLQPSENTQRKIYISNVGEELDPKKLRDFFSKYGEIEEGPLGLDRETGKPKGFCLFVYKSIEAAKSALLEPLKQFEGVTLYCRQAIDGPKPQKMQSSHSFRNSVVKNQEFVDNVAPVQAPPLWQQPLNVDAAALGQALTALMVAQGTFGAVGGGAGPISNPAFVPGFGSQVMEGGYGYGYGGVGTVGGVNMGYSGMGEYGNQGGDPGRQKKRKRNGRRSQQNMDQ